MEAMEMGYCRIYESRTHNHEVMGSAKYAHEPQKYDSKDDKLCEQSGQESDQYKPCREPKCVWDESSSCDSNCHNKCDRWHNHRFAAVSGPEMKSQKSHVHEVRFATDTFEDHYHDFCGLSGPAILVGGGRHVHFVCGETTRVEGHYHDFIVATLIEDPTK